MITGRISFLHPQGYGWIVVDGGQRFYFHVSGLVAREADPTIFNHLKPGQYVTFKIGERNGQERAVGIELVVTETESNV